MHALLCSTAAATAAATDVAAAVATAVACSCHEIKTAHQPVAGMVTIMQSPLLFAQLSAATISVTATSCVFLNG